MKRVGHRAVHSAGAMIRCMALNEAVQGAVRLSVSCASSPWGVWGRLERERQTGHARRLYSSSLPSCAGGGEQTVDSKWVRRDGSILETAATVGKTLLNVAHKYDIELEGACEGVCACATCHVILPGSVFAALPEASEEEEDMLDQAFGLTSTSRLGCQVVVAPEHAGMEVRIPKATRNFYVDGHVPKPH